MFAVFCGCMVYMAEPYQAPDFAVVHDSTNGATYVASRFANTTVRQVHIKHEIWQLLEDLRTIPADPGALTFRLNRVPKYLSPKASAFVAEYWGDDPKAPDSHNPYVSAKTKNVTVSPISFSFEDENTLVAIWLETAQAVGGGPILSRRRMQANVTFTIEPPKDVKSARHSPVGLVVTGISWAELN